MSLMETATLAKFLDVDDCAELQAPIDQAEAALAAWIGADTLEETARTEVIIVHVSRKVLPTTYAPVTALTSLVGESKTYDPTRQGFGKWSVSHRDGFIAQDEVTATYTTGWAAWDDVPGALQVGLLTIAKYFRDNGGRVVLSEKIGDWSATYQALSSDDAFPPMVDNLVRQWRAPA